MTPPPLKPNPSSGSVGECGIQLDAGTPELRRREKRLQSSRILLIPFSRSSIITCIYTGHRGPLPPTVILQSLC